MTYGEVKTYIEQGLITDRRHPENEDVAILNYTAKCQFERAWDDVTMQCRGLIMNVKTGEVLARPFKKFFNYGERIERGFVMPTEQPIITEKMDGSLGILYLLNGKPWIATRGSFVSDQALWATNWWRREMKDFVPIDNSITHLFEIVYPENTIVVRYDFSGLVHLASIDTAKGYQVPVSLPIRKTREIVYPDVQTLHTIIKQNEEGFVIYYPHTDLRLKIKGEEYIRLHKLLTGVSQRVIWDLLREGLPFDTLLDQVPDEFYDWVKSVSAELKRQYWAIESRALMQFDAIEETSSLESDRKWWAERILKMTHPQLGFAMLDKKDYSQILWKMLQPHSEKPFKLDDA